MVRLINHNHLEALLCAQVDLLCLRDLFQQILHNYSVVIADIRRRDLEVVDRGDNVEFEFAVARGLEDACVDLYLFNTGAVELLERGDDAGFLAGT